MKSSRDDRVIIRPFEEIEVVGESGKRHKLEALIDTGARISSIDKLFAREIGVFDEDKIVGKGTYSSALGRQSRPLIELTFWLKGVKVQTKVNVSDRSKRSRKFWVGRRNLVGFLVQVNKGDDKKQTPK